VKLKKNPCIDICKFSGPNDWCVGCGRTKLERKKWKDMKKKAKKKLREELQERMLRLKTS
tara:strand:+ start:534 stop:713 length:180 start_codon:yes stop_codon:yes gene_type:complete